MTDELEDVQRQLAEADGSQLLAAAAQLDLVTLILRGHVRGMKIAAQMASNLQYRRDEVTLNAAIEVLERHGRELHAACGDGDELVERMRDGVAGLRRRMLRPLDGGPPVCPVHPGTEFVDGACPDCKETWRR